MNSNKFPFIIIVLLIIFTVVKSSIFIVHEVKQAIVTQFGKPIGDPKSDPGIHFKVPLIQKVQYFDRRFLEWDGSPNQIPTKDKRFIWVDTYARWRITDPLLFFKRVKDERGAQTRLDDILDGETRNAIASHELVELIRSTNRTPLIDEDIQDDQGDETFPEINKGRTDIAAEILAKAGPRTLEMGIELLDLQFKRINYVDEVRQKIYERMITERKRIAEQYRSEGHGEASKILGNKERELSIIRSKSFKEAEEIKGDADAKAANVYASAYNQSADSREFYRFLKTMESYKKVFGPEDMLILDTNNKLFQAIK